MKRTIVYYDRPGRENTGETLRLARQRANELRVTDVIVASSTGYTAGQAMAEFATAGVTLTIVSTKRESFDSRMIDALQTAGHRVVFTDEIVHVYPESVANAYRKVCEGLKVAVQIASIAVDAGYVAGGAEVVAVAGTGAIAFPAGGGADTAIVITPGPSAEHGEAYVAPPKEERRRVREILCMPR